MSNNQLGYHPEYGLTDEIRLKAIKDAQLYSTKVAANKNNVSLASVYKWAKRAEDVA